MGAGIKDLDNQITTWAKAAAKGFSISLEPPAHAEKPTVHAYLLEVVPDPPSRGARRAPLQFRARYLVTVAGEDALKSHATLSDLLFSALEHREWEVEQRSVPVSIWNGFGIAARPSFLLSATVRKELPETPAKQVREAVFLPTTVSSLYGLVVTPDDLPVPMARVELPQLDVLTNTDSRGRFHFPRVPAEPAARLIAVTAKGRRRVYEATALATEEDPLLLRFDMKEE